MERRNLRDGQVEQISIKARCLLVIPLDGLGRQLLVYVLAEELLQKHRECRGQRGGDACRSIGEFVLPLFVEAPTSLGVLGLALG
jgi:hypothetical protein